MKKSFNSSIALVRATLTVGLALSLWVGIATISQAQVLTGSGSHVPLAPVGYPPFVGPTLTENIPLYTLFTGTWSASAAAAWVGTFAGTGPIPAGGARPSGASTYNFSGLAGGVLPVGTYFALSDVDHSGGPAEFITLRAFDSANAVITSPWLNTTLAMIGASSLNDMPGWDWNITTPNTYTFDGGTVVGNPTVGLLFLNNQSMLRLEVSRNNRLSNFSLVAPLATATVTVTAIPTLSEWGLIALAGLLALWGVFTMRKKTS